MKNSQIEEIKNNARIHIGATVEKLRMDGCELWEIDGIVESILNYITVSEDSVVLSREEYETWFKKDGYYLGYRDGENSAVNYYENLALPSTKMETAEKFINLLTNNGERQTLPIEDDKGNVVDKAYIIPQSYLKQVIKELGADTKE
jgi:hypothetical protein